MKLINLSPHTPFFIYPVGVQVFSEYRLEAIVAARLEKIAVCGTNSFPGRAQFAASPQFSKSVRHWLRKQGFGSLVSVLSLYEEQTPRFVASSPSLEPFPDDVIYVGPLTTHSIVRRGNEQDPSPRPKDAILVYMGNGALLVKALVETFSAATKNKSIHVYIEAGRNKKQPHPNVLIAPRFNFSEFLPRAEVFVNHGGQNSIMDGLLAGVPQIKKKYDTNLRTLEFGIEDFNRFRSQNGSWIRLCTCRQPKPGAGR